MTFVLAAAETASVRAIEKPSTRIPEMPSVCTPRVNADLRRLVLWALVYTVRVRTGPGKPGKSWNFF